MLGRDENAVTKLRVAVGVALLPVNVVMIVFVSAWTYELVTQVGGTPALSTSVQNPHKTIITNR